MTVRVVFSPQARDQARRAAQWWRDHRPAAPRLFAHELRAALALISRSPTLGVSHPHPTVAGVRRLLLSRTGYHLYFVPNQETATIEIVAVWSAVRGRAPQF